MSKGTGANGRRLMEGAASGWALALAAAWMVPAQAASVGQVDAIALAQAQAPRQQGAGLEGRVKTLSKALDLDARQQSELRKVLEKQREQVRRVWADNSVPSAYRIAETRVIGDRAADEIRSLLNEEQRKKYKPPKPGHDATRTAKPNVEDWMNRAGPK